MKYLIKDRQYKRNMFKSMKQLKINLRYLIHIVKLKKNGYKSIMAISMRNLIIFSVLILPCFISNYAYGDNQAHKEEYIAVSGLIDLRSTFSDGLHSIEELVLISRTRGFKVLFINDHDRIALSYGIPPFRNVLRFKKEYPSIMTHGPEKFLKEVRKVSEKYPDMLIIPGCEISAYYYWKGSYFNDDLTVHEFDKKILVLNLENPDDYSLIPNFHNSLSLKFTKEFLPGSFFFIIPLLIGIVLFLGKLSSKPVSILLIAVSVLALANYNPFRSSRFSAYDGDQGIKPFQELINYVNEKGGFSFWNYPEQKSGIRKHGPIYTDTPPYPEAILESVDYTGFAALYGDNITLTNPGNLWDQALNEYCRGERENAPWGISAADFHEDGRHKIKLGAFPTTFLVKRFSKQDILEALKLGRMYSSRGDSVVWPKIEEFSVTGSGGEKAVMGETLTTKTPPVIKFQIEYNYNKKRKNLIHLIRGGEILKSYETSPLVEVEYKDLNAPKGEKTFYRIMDNAQHLTSNPIFVTYNPG